MRALAWRKFGACQDDLGVALDIGRSHRDEDANHSGARSIQINLSLKLVGPVPWQLPHARPLEFVVVSRERESDYDGADVSP